MPLLRYTTQPPRRAPQSLSLGSLGLCMSRFTSIVAVFAIPLFVCANSQAEDSAEDTPADKLTAAVYNGDFNAVKSLLSAGADVNAKNRSGKRALYYAALHGHDDIALFLIQRGALIETTGGTYYGTSLMNAASSRCIKTLRLLLQRGVRTNTKDEKGWTAMMLAAHKNDLEAVRLLAEHRGSRLNLRNWGGDTALHCAAWSNAVDVVEYLLERGADATIKNDADWTAFDYARYHSTCSWEGDAFTHKATKIMTLLQRHSTISAKWPNCCTSTRCPQCEGVWRKEAGSSRQNEGDGSYSQRGSKEDR